MTELITAGNIETLLVGLLVAFLVVFTTIKTPPSLTGMKDFVEMLNSRGGNMALLALMTVYFFHHAIKMFYIILQQIQAKTLTADNAVALMAIQFVTSHCFEYF